MVIRLLLLLLLPAFCIHNSILVTLAVSLQAPKAKPAEWAIHNGQSHSNLTQMLQRQPLWTQPHFKDLAVCGVFLWFSRQLQVNDTACRLSSIPIGQVTSVQVENSPSICDNFILSQQEVSCESRIPLSGYLPLKYKKIERHRAGRD